MNAYKLGIDIGSTTAKVVLTDVTDTVIFSDYVRHNTRILETLLLLLDKIRDKFGNIQLQAAFSGSTAMGIAESTNSAFIQEIIAAASLVTKRYPGVKSLIDIGGEDAKLVLFNDFKNPDIRMNGNCAGGTGAYIDQMAALLNVSIAKLNDLAWQSSKTYPIASRCGVFAKTDVQNLVSRKISTADIAASIFEAVAGQLINSLARGRVIEPSILFCGGPLTYISFLRESFSRILKITNQNIIVPEHAELFTALGTALSIPATQEPSKISEFIHTVRSAKPVTSEGNTLQALFRNKEEATNWENTRYIIKIPEREVLDKGTCFLGVDSGSTTTKIVILDSRGNILYHYYKNNDGKPLEAVMEGLKEFAAQLKKNNTTIRIGKSAVTGYGEELIKSALGLDYGVVETVAHFIAAQKIEPEVSFILDIGGQDIKAIFVQNGTITNIEINEACSSGCGSFIEGFANTLGYSPGDFAALATQSKAPYDLGSRCTVFMNSKVKQALRDGATIPDLSAGLSYSVVKNCLNKVLRIKNYSDIGDNIVVQGGTFKNIAVFRSLEVLSGKKIVISDKPELMGAYGAALYASNKSNSEGLNSSFIGFGNLENAIDYTLKLSNCKGCTNKCQITTYKFPNGGICFSGNKCEKIFTNNTTPHSRGLNIFEYKNKILFDREPAVQPTSKIRIGIPRVLNIYENYPFWQSLFLNCGFQVVLSDESGHQLYKKGTGALMSDNICFPAKLAHGHIVNLLDKKVDRIFLPLVIYEKSEFEKSSNSYNCPIVTGYSEVLKNTTYLAESAETPFDSPAINFNDPGLLKKALWKYCKTLGVSSITFNKAFKTALSAQEEFKAQVKLKNEEILEDAIQNNKQVVLVGSHPYHIDHFVHQQVSQILSDFGVNVINEEIASGNKNEGFDSFFSISQWEYPNRILQAAWWASKQKFPIGFIQLNSFGCGPDSFIMDEIGDLTKRSGLSYALVRIDEISSPGSIKLRLRSLVESLKLKTQKDPAKIELQSTIGEIAVFHAYDKHRTILVPWFSDFYSPIIPPLGKIAGYKFVNLPPSDKQSVDLGLEYANNEICYPATLVVGDVIRALRSHQYDPNEIAVGITQTGGQCRATNYLALIKRAMANEGFANIPIVAIAPSSALFNNQPGFKLEWHKFIKPAFAALLFCDSLSRLYYATASREPGATASNRLKVKYLNKAKELLERNSYDEFIPLLQQTVADFNAIPVEESKVPSVGIVGEIYIKYNAFGQFNIIDWLVEHHIEIVLPPLLEFFTQSFVNTKARCREFIDKTNFFGFTEHLLEWMANIYINKFEKILTSFKFHRPVHNIHHSAQFASEILNLNNQYGEGWLIPAEIASFAKQDINNVVCIQPFGCIANHIVGKGMEMKIKSLYPDVNLLFLDFDSGTSRVNILNRLHFLIQNIEKTYADPAINYH
ncbi:MAG: acyl-CoA dehydratase activase-related protein [Bacteroidales bacterium]|nr:acyl-CoA dehydratase activase-related protein [Bacteroidales bacterium]